MGERHADHREREGEDEGDGERGHDREGQAVDGEDADDDEREPHEGVRFARANLDLTDVSVKVGRRMMTLFPTVGLVMNLGTVAVMWFGSLRIASGDLQVGQLTASAWGKSARSAMWAKAPSTP